jgi:hypothetical protein
VGFAEVRLQSFHKDVDGQPVGSALKIEEDLQHYIRQARTKIELIKRQIFTLKEGVPERLHLFISNRAAEMTSKVETLEPRLKAAEEPVEKSREAVGDRVCQLEDEVAGLIKYHQRIRRIDVEALFNADIDTKKDGKLDKDEFFEFFSKCEKDPVVVDASRAEDSRKRRVLTGWPSKEELEIVFGRMEKDKDGFVSKAIFLRFLREFMRVVKATAITTHAGMQGQAIRRVLPGEVVEVLEGPVRDDVVQTLRVKAKTLVDAVEGWITMESNKGTAFLEDGGKVFKFKVGERGAWFTENFKYKIKVSNLKLEEGELLESRDCAYKDERSGLMRMKVRMKSDGREGWVTAVGSRNEQFLKAV